MTTLTYMQLLRGNRSFRRLWAGQVISEIGNWFNFIAGLGLVRSVSGAAPEATAVMVVALLAPFALFAPLAGTFVDRWSRRSVMIAADGARAIVALGFLLVRGPEDLWIAYSCSVLSSLLSAFFEAAKNASMPNIVGNRGLLAGNALMFSSRFLLMSFGAALGGIASARFGYQTAFVINSLSFLVSAYSIWLIPERETRQAGSVREASGGAPEPKQRVSFWKDLREGWSYVARHRIVAALIGVNILWATGGGAINLIYDRIGGVVFAGRGGLQGDAGVAAVYTAVGAGLFIGMMLARRVGAHVELHGLTARFIGWAIFAHGVLFAIAGLMPTLWLSCLMFFLSRVVIGLEFAVHETLMMRLLPDDLRGRIFTTDRAAEVSVMSVSAMVAGWSLNVISPRALTIISGLLSASPGVVWLALFTWGKLRLPANAVDSPAAEETDETLLASAG
ncbi:MAG TPA: MFS transporter [Pyrinomonadaceae bacterium]|nr:MFS transporter [Pyrinomonadaceae bacterium]